MECWNGGIMDTDSKKPFESFGAFTQYSILPFFQYSERETSGS
jgi:hypothetical protein